MIELLFLLALVLFWVYEAKTEAISAVHVPVNKQGVYHKYRFAEAVFVFIIFCFGCYYLYFEQMAYWFLLVAFVQHVFAVSIYEHVWRHKAYGSIFASKTGLYTIQVFGKQYHIRHWNCWFWFALSIISLFAFVSLVYLVV